MISEIVVLALLGCDPALTRLFTPLHPQLGRYEVCTDSRPIEAVARQGWTIEEAEALDVFGLLGTYDRSALARLFGGRRARVARGWIQEGDHFESQTLVTPYPDASLTRLEPGTLVIKWIIELPANSFELSDSS